MRSACQRLLGRLQSSTRLVATQIAPATHLSSGASEYKSNDVGNKLWLTTAANAPITPATSSTLSLQRREFSVAPKKSIPPACPRDPRFNAVQSEDIEYFRKILGDEGVLLDSHDIEPYNSDWMRKWTGKCPVVLRPASTKEVSLVMKHCHARNLAVVPQGGNTGLVGGSIPVYDEIVLSLARMDKVETLEPIQGIVTVQAGCILERLTSYLESHDLTTPLDLGAKGSCMIGGNIATNAGGLRYVRYGSLRGTVLGLEVVLADGTILDALTSLRKDNTGYDLKQLFIGSEGTLGVITRASILCPRKPTSVQVIFLALRTYDEVLRAMKLARTHLQEIISATEFQDLESLNLVTKHIPGARDPLPERSAFYMLIETSGSNATHDAEKIAEFLAALEQEDLYVNGTIAESEKQAQELWKLRESISESLGKEGYVYKYDVSLPVTEMYALVEKTRMRLQNASAHVVGYGHLGDGNLHLNIVCPKADNDVLSLLEPWLFEELKAYRGSVSAEHGLGQAKNSFIYYSKSPENVDLMMKVKQFFDPKGILNPYKVLPHK